MKKLLLMILALCFLAACASSIDEPPDLLPDAAYWPGTGLVTPSPQPTSPPNELTETPMPTIEPTVEPTPQPAAQPTSQPTPAPLVTASPVAVPAGIVNPFPTTFMSAYDDNGQLLRDSRSWGFVRNADHQPPPLRGGRWGFDIRPFNAVHLGDFSGNYLYLTFDLGYEYRFTPVILDTLRDKGVYAAFFITGGYLIQNPDLVRRMVNEGHLVVNHGRHHHSNPTLNAEQLTFEIMKVDRLFQELIGQPMSRFYRPPYGEYSAFSLDFTNQLGWKTVFWSIAYVDWVTTNQPGRDYVINHFHRNIHPGAIVLMHTVSQSNAEALPYVIEWLWEQGYTFKSLYDLP